MGKKGKGGHGAQGFYKGYWCDSSWELAWVLYNIDHQITFERNTKGFEYFYQKKKHLFYPDFKFNERQYIEIKGVVTDSLRDKIRCFPHSLIILFEDQMKFYLDYAKSNYGKNFIDLYDK